MRVSLLHNPKAGRHAPSSQELVRLIERAGHTVQYHSTRQRGWKRALRDPGDLVVVAGGDGTVCRVLRRSPGQPVPLTILPVGTANNVARSLGFAGDTEEIVAAWPGFRRRGLDLGFARAGRRERRFAESAGLGVLATMIAALDGRAAGLNDTIAAREGPAGYVRLLRDMLPRYEPHACRLRLDGRERSGRFLLLEAMNIPLVGPGLALAPDADAGDGWLDVVLVHEDERPLLEAHLAARGDGEDAPPLPFERARRVEIEWTRGPLRLDDRMLDDDGAGEATLTLESRAVQLLVPAPPGSGGAWGAQLPV